MNESLHLLIRSLVVSHVTLATHLLKRLFHRLSYGFTYDLLSKTCSILSRISTSSPGQTHLETS